MPPDRGAAALQELIDRRAIHDLVLRYCRAIDRLDLEAVRACYHPDGVDHHTGFSGVRDDYVAWVGNALARLDGTLHVVANHLSQVTGDIGHAETYGLGFHWGEPRDDHRRNFVSAFRYIDRLERRDGAWRIAERVAVREWTRALPESGWMEREAEGPSAVRDASDPVYLFGGARRDDLSDRVPRSHRGSCGRTDR